MSACLRDVTTFRLGGPCRSLHACRTADELCAALRAAPAALLIGGGSNLLVADDGVDAEVIRFASDTPDVRPVAEGLEVSGATMLDDLARIGVESGFEGLVCCSGIPGTVGGAIAGNAGAFGEQIGDVVESMCVADRSGLLRTVPASELGFAYRRSNLPQHGGVVVSARLRLRVGDRAALAARRTEILALRAQKHPDWRATPTAGSFFKNIEPTSKAGRRQAAGWFLEQAGALAMRVGGAHPFERHANIIVADPGCRAADVLALSQQMAAAVRARFQLDLEREVRLIGFPAGA
jgi:UDP-N-acetylmuramate dehydrogenase